MGEMKVSQLSELDTDEALKSTSIPTTDKVAIALYEHARRRLCTSLVDWCESPIEQLFLVVAIDYLLVSPCIIGAADRKLLPESWRGSGLVGGCPTGFFLQQLEVSTAGGLYRLDFALIDRGYKIAVELDGHDFHERTKEQAQRDKSRDRALVADGWQVLRFTGSEVYRDPVKCAGELEQLACKLAPKPRPRRKARP